MHEYELQAEALREQRDRERERSDRYFAENGKIIAEVMGLRLENERLLKLIQAQDKLIRASDSAQEMQLADQLAGALRNRLSFGYLPGDGEAKSVLTDYDTRRGNEEVEEGTKMDSGKRVS